MTATKRLVGRSRDSYNALTGEVRNAFTINDDRANFHGMTAQQAQVLREAATMPEEKAREYLSQHGFEVQP